MLLYLCFSVLSPPHPLLCFLIILVLFPLYTFSKQQIIVLILYSIAYVLVILRTACLTYPKCDACPCGKYITCEQTGLFVNPIECSKLHLNELYGQNPLKQDSIIKGTSVKEMELLSLFIQLHLLLDFHVSFSDILQVLVILRLYQPHYVLSTHFSFPLSFIILKKGSKGSLLITFLSQGLCSCGCELVPSV